MRHEGPVTGWVAPGTVAARTQVTALGTALAGLGASRLIACTDDEVADDLVSLTRMHAQLTSQLLRYAAEADRRKVGEATGATSTAAWWAHASKLTRGEANRMIGLARALDAPERQLTSVAFAGGHVLTDQTHVIVHAVAALPADVPADVPGKAEAFLLDAAGDHDAKALRVMGRRILDIVAPHISEAHEERLLLAEEQAANAAVRLSMVDDGHGRTHGRFTLPTAQAQMLRQHLLALMNPRRHPTEARTDATAGQAGVSDDTERAVLRPIPERMGAAFVGVSDLLCKGLVPLKGT